MGINPTPVPFNAPRSTAGPGEGSHVIPSPAAPPLSGPLGASTHLFYSSYAHIYTCIMQLRVEGERTQLILIRAFSDLEKMCANETETC